MHFWQCSEKQKELFPMTAFHCTNPHLGWEVPGKAFHRSFNFITTDSVLKNSSNADEETHSPAKTLVQMGLSKWFLAAKWFKAAKEKEQHGRYAERERWVGSRGKKKLPVIIS